MMVLLQKASQVSISIADTAAATDTGEAAVGTVEQTHDLVASTSSLIGDPLALTLWFIAVLAFLGIWYQLSKPPYPVYRGIDGVRKGPFCRFRDAIANSVGVFLP